MTQTAESTNASREMVVIIRPSFKRLCRQDACRAALYNHLLYWIAQKAKGQEASQLRSGEVYWYGSAEDICAGLDHSWSVWKVRKELETLAASLLGRRHNPAKGWDREYQYFFGEAQGALLRAACLEHHICLLHLGLPAEVVHLLETTHAIDENRRCICGIQQMDLLKTADGFTENSRAIPKITPKITTKDSDKEESNTVTVVAHTHTAFLEQCSQQELEALLLLARARLPALSPPKETVILSEAASPPKEAVKPAAALPAAETSPAQPPQKPSRKEGQKKRRTVNVTTEVALTLQGAHVLDLYDNHKGRKTIRSADALRAANGLGEVVRSDEDFVAVLAAIASDSFLRQKQVRIDLDFVYRKYDGFLDRVERTRGKQQQGSVQTDYNKVATMTGDERAAYKQEQQEKLKQAQPPGIDREALMKLTPEERIAVLKQWRKPPLSA